MKKLLAGSVVVALFALWLNLSQGQEPAKKVTIKEVMNKAMKGNDALVKKVSGGKGTEADAKELKTLYEGLAANKPPKGSDESWKTKTTALVDAAQAAIDKKPDAKAKLDAASKCADCHTAHKG